MRRSAAHAGVSVLVLGAAGLAFAPSAAAGESPPDDGPVVVATGLDNPRQLTWGQDGELLVAEAGSGGDTCVTLPAPPGAPAEELAETVCAGTTGGVTVIEHPGHGGSAHRVVDGLFSIAGADGSFAVGSNGADATDVPGEYVVAETYVAMGLPPELAAAPGAEQLGHLLVVGTGGGEQFVLPYADIAAAEAAQNPDGAQVDSNPYAVLFVDPTPDRATGTDGYALVADAAANAVWKVQPDFAGVPADCVDAACIPTYAITVFAAFPTPPDDDLTPEFVPTSLATDDAGNVYVGGLGSEVTGAAEVRQFAADGTETGGWGGFTGITGLAVDGSGEHLYVSQLFGSATPAGPPSGPVGNVVAVDVAAGTYRSVDVPFPGGVAVDDHGRVYVAALSVAPAEGVAATPVSPASEGGQVWQISFGGSADVGLPVAFPLDTGGEWVTAEPTATPLPDVCGGLLLSPGDVTGEWRVTRDETGDRIEYRGASTVDLVGPDGTVLVDELDIGGSGEEFYAADGSAAFTVNGPDLIWAFPEEVAPLAELGLPAAFYWTSGTFADTISAEGVVEITSVPADAVDLCSLLP
ncbi:ScyD/ScyE family protein [Modestobacter versicolor]|uniref:ScyD/ScyE family protein n=1 Tax=Modestobacter versicolor TaxID=429133 RepID=UPI0034DE246A